MSFKSGMNDGMNEQKLREGCLVSLDRLDTRAKVEKVGGADLVPATTTTGTKERCMRGGGEMPPPGPACSKARNGSRNRSGSTSSTSSHISRASAALEAERKSRREAARNANRLIEARDAESGDEPQSPIEADSDEPEEGSTNPEKGKPHRKRRKAKAVEGGESSSSEATRGKRGRPITTGEYVGLAAAREEANKKLREAVELEEEMRIGNLSASDVLSNVKVAVEDKLEELEFAPTEDVAQRARQSMVEVLKVIKCSRNLKGSCVKILKTAAVVTTAAAEILRTRADSSKSDSEAFRQVKAMRKELELVKQEAKTTKEEARRDQQEIERLRKELEKTKGGRRSGRRVRAVTENSPPQSPEVTKNDAEEPDASTVIMEVDDPPPSTEVAKEEELVLPVETPGPPEYCDIRRKQELLPPGSVVPPAYRPPVRGKVRVLEDGILAGHRVRVVDGAERASVAAHRSDERPKTNETQSLVDTLAPAMLEWLKKSLSALGLVAAGESSKGDSRPVKRKDKRGKESTPNLPRSAPEKVREEKGGGLHPTTEPNKELWSAKVGKKSGGNAPLPPPAKQKEGSRDPHANAGLTIPGSEEWIEVRKKKRKTKKTSSSTDSKTPAGRGPQRESSAVGRAQVRGSTARPMPKPASATGKKEGGKRQGNSVKKAPGRKPPRTAAVTLTCPPDGYADAMRIAREKVNLQDLGIQSLRPKRAVTGAIILEVPGPDGAERAAVLRDKMEGALRDVEGVKVTRPVKQGELRIKGILESTTIAEIKEAISRLGNCKVDEVRTGEIRPAPNGTGTLWVRCPIAAANKAAAAGRLGLGWSTPTVEALEPRQMRCFKCLEQGHVQVACPNPVDRRSLCYRCCQGGHLARTCDRAPFCVVCSEMGQPSAHIMGGNACKAPKRKTGLPRRARPPPAVRMEVKTEDASPAVRGEPARKGRTPVPVRRGNRKEEHRSAVRGGPSQPMGGGAPSLYGRCRTTR